MILLSTFVTMRRYSPVFILFILFMIPGSCPGQTGEPDGRLLVRQYLESTNIHEMEDILKSLESLHADINKIKEWIRISANYKAQQPGLQRNLVSIGERKGEYFVYVPAGYVPGKPWPTILALHGVGGNGLDSVMAWLKSSMHNDRFILVAPTYGPGLWWKDEAEGLILSVFHKTKQDYNIDANRVYLTGFSSGGHGAWYMALRYPDLFSAINPIAGECPMPSLLINLLHVPVYIVHGAQDAVIPVEAARDADSRLEGLHYNVLYREIPEMKHRFPLAETEKILNWFCAQKRLLYPKKIRFSTESTKYTSAYWLEILEFSELIGQTSGIQKDISGRPKRYEGLTVTASVDADIKDTSNEIYVAAHEIKAVRIYLDDELVDLERPLHVYINGKSVYRGKVERNLRALLDTVKKRNDREALFSAYLDFKVPSE